MSSLSNHLALLATSGHHCAGLVHTAPSNIYHTPCVFFAAHTTRRHSPPRRVTSPLSRTHARCGESASRSAPRGDRGGRSREGGQNGRLPPPPPRPRLLLRFLCFYRFARLETRTARWTPLAFGRNFFAKADNSREILFRNTLAARTMP